jgi:translation initiation factor 2 beta subunit (eIF-2beta)/eIF-5
MICIHNLMNIQIESSFNKLVTDAYHILDNQSYSQNLILPELDVDINTTRLHWKNIINFLEVVKRDSEHFIEWLKSEMPNKEISWFSGSKSDGLLIHGKRQKKSDIADLALKYVSNYIVCSSCKRVDTQMIKIKHKQYEFKCFDCGMKKFIN